MRKGRRSVAGYGWVLPDSLPVGLPLQKKTPRQPPLTHMPSRSQPNETFSTHGAVARTCIRKRTEQTSCPGSVAVVT